jgi:NAD(P)-dependent dehydrogenase (short-subunit alcohol dehydrogenase family)
VRDLITPRGIDDVELGQGGEPPGRPEPGLDIPDGSLDRSIPPRRIALVTGASRGIGRGIALGLAAAGAAVAVNYRRDEAAAADVVDQIRKTGGHAEAIQASVSDTDGVAQLTNETLKRFGGVDIVVLNAGVASRGLPIAETTEEEVRHVVGTHALAAHELIRRLLPTLRKAPRADVIAISSSELNHMRANGAPYNMAKAALEALALTLAREEASNGIRVNIVAPGLVITDMGLRLIKAKLGIDNIAELDAAQPFKRVCRPEDVAAVVRMLVSDPSAMVTGQRIIVDGGTDPLAD